MEKKMKMPKFTEAQIVAILKECERAIGGGYLPGAPDQQRDVLSMEIEIRGDGSIGPEADEGAHGCNFKPESYRINATKITVRVSIEVNEVLKASLLI
jgi:hypothetical protein